MGRRPTLLTIAVLLAPALSGVARGDGLPDSFTLGRYIPKSCWLYIHEVDNPERAAIDAQWKRVFSAVDTGAVVAAFKDLLAGPVSEADQAALDEEWATCQRLCSDVKWSDLGGREFAFGIQLSPLPAHLFLCRGTDGTGPHNLAALAAILEHIASLKDNMSVGRRNVGDIQRWTMDIPGAPFVVELFGRDDLIGLCTNSTIADDAIALMNGKSAGGSILDAPRFQQALATITPPEDAVSFLDMRGMFADLEAFGKVVMAQAARGGGEQPPEHGIIFKILDRLNIFDYILTTQQTDGRRELVDSVIALDPQRADSLFAKVFTDRKPVDQPLHLIPADATGFSVSSLVNWDRLYALILDVVRQEVPDGENLLAEWEAIQQRIGFDVQRDVLDWLSGETISIAFAGGGPFGAGEAVLMIRVKDPKLAAEKVTAGIARLDQDVFRKYANVPLTMLPADQVKADGFHMLVNPMFMALQLQPVIGVHEEWLMVGTSAGSINKVLDTAAGKSESIAACERFKAEGIIPAEGAMSVSFSDLSDLGQNLSTMCYSIGVFGGMIPDQPETRVIKTLLSTAQAVAPALQKIDFYSSSAMSATFDGLTWRVKGVTTYKASALALE